MAMTSQQLVRAAGISYRQLDFWVRKNYIRTELPDIGSGYVRTFSDVEARTVMLAGRLVRLGLVPELACSYARAMIVDFSQSIEIAGFEIRDLSPELNELPEEPEVGSDDEAPVQ